MSTKYRTARPMILATTVAFALLLGCAKVPEQEVDAARQALESARQAGAADYAPDALRRAEDAVAQLDAELEAQEKKFALTRSYDKATELATNARSSAEKAVNDAVTGKDQARTEAETLIGEARTALDQAKSLLASAPAGKGTQVDIQALQADLTEVERAIGEADRAYQEGRFHESRVKAETAKSSAMRVQADVEAARSAKARSY